MDNTKQKRMLARAEEHRKYMKEAYREAATDARNGRCASAFNNIKRASRLEEASREAARAAGAYMEQVARIHKDEQMYIDIDSQFRHACLVGGGLKGLLSRRRRTRR
jgi:hypothetical protein